MKDPRASYYGGVESLKALLADTKDIVGICTILKLLSINEWK